MSDLSVNIAGIEFKNPVLTASGTFGYGSEIQGLYDVEKLGGLITKTITRKPRPGNRPPRLAETTAGMLNSIGLANVGIDAFISEKLTYLKSVKTRIIVNIAGESHFDFLELIKILEDEEGIDGYELNLSCPNVAGGLDFSTDPGLTEKLVSDARKITERMIIPKLTPNVTDITEIAAAAENGGADAVSLINTLLGMSVDIKSRKPKLGNVLGGLSGPAIKPAALAKVFTVCKSVKIPVIGIGGICTAEDVLEFLICGATAVQLGTINFVDPLAPVKAIDGLRSYLAENGIGSVKEVIGTIDA